MVILKVQNMKTSIALVSGLALVSSPFVSSVSAGDREWATAGKVLTGIAAVHVLSRAFSPPPVYQTTYVVPSTPVFVQQPQVVYLPAQPLMVQQQSQQIIANAPTVAPAPIASAAPVYAPATPSYVVQQPVYVQQPPVYVTAPTFYAAPYYSPAPIISFGFGFGHYGGYGCGPRQFRGHHGW